ncbi:MAG: hypothetical protein ACT4TC_23865 [Myxococcaceae bacterium]
MTDLTKSRALWNRTELDLSSDELLAQILDRGSMDDWRALYALAESDAQLRRRIVSTIYRVPVPLPHFWLAALQALGEQIDLNRVLPTYERSWI